MELFKDFPKEVTLTYSHRSVRYELLSCARTKKGIFCTVLKDGKKLDGICLKSLLNSRFYVDRTTPI